MAEPLATIDDVEVRLPTPLNPTDGQRVQQLLLDASSVVRNYTRRAFTLTTETVTIRPISGKLRLPQRPVVGVSSVKVISFGRELVVPYRFWDGGDEVWLFDENDQQHTLNLSLSTLEAIDTWRTPNYKVTYTHGYDEVPDDIVAVVASMVVRTLQTPSQTISTQGVGPYSYTTSLAAQAGALGLDAAARQILGTYRRAGSTVEMR